MTQLYHTATTAPAPLPHRIRLSDGRSRTDPSSFTAEEIADAGYIASPPQPDHDLATQRLTWDGIAWGIEDVPAPDPIYRDLDSAALISLLETAGGMTPELVVQSSNDPNLTYFWLLLKVSPFTSRGNPKLPGALAGLEALGYLPNGASAVLDGWPTA
ncbi:hypothetical protein [Phaeobacter inhibens]|uniref:hypothetical protein n=1 Tax=Phaeobacter inhibens TaxID=221822 RepID=UPI000C9A57B3|nr:hypothetical protein [Phaeobacter inhibens]AUQ64447.1 hypothetical protein PhaeoP51_03516 [Phaeobacter inhibens]